MGPVLASTWCTPPAYSTAEWTQRRECALRALSCFRRWSGEGLQGASGFLNVWLSPSMVGCLDCFPLSSGKSVGWGDWLQGDFPRATSRSALLEHPFGTKCVERAGPVLDTLTEKHPFRFLVERMLKLAGKTHPLSDVPPTTFRLYPMIF